MLLPNKITSYQESVISKFPGVLTLVSKKTLSVYSLHKELKNRFDDIEDFLVTLDCLYALGKINFNEKDGVVYYVSDVS
jgi:hypothetical protein